MAMSQKPKKEAVPQSGNNLELYSYVWCDAKINTPENIQAQMKLRSSINHLQTFDNKEDCEQCIKEVKHERVILIISGSIGKLMIPDIHGLQQLTCIYIYCGNVVYHETWTKDYKKVAGVFDDPSALLQKILKDQKLREQAHIDSTPLSFFDPSKNSGERSLKTLTTENGSFLYFQLLISVLLSMKPLFEWQKNTKDRLVKLCKDNYKGNPNELQILEEFDENYTSSDAIRWYTKDSCLYRLLNKALRAQDITMLVVFRFLISDIFGLLSKQSKDFFSSNETKVSVYRGQTIGIEELDRLKTSVDEFVSINSFLSTSRKRDVALKFAISLSNTNYVKRILFEIEIDVHMNLPVDKPFGDIKTISCFPEEEEILFMIGSIFKIDSSKYDQHNDVWIIKLILCSEDDYELKDEFKYIRDELIGKASNDGQPVATLGHLGHLLVKMGDFDEAEKCYKEMLVELDDEHYNDQEKPGIFIFATIVRLNGLIQSYKGLRNIANHRKDKETALYFEKKAKKNQDILDRLLKMITSKFKDNSNSNDPTHTAVAREFWSQGQLDLALENYEKAREKYSKNGNKEGLIRCNYQSALVCNDAKRWDLALEYFFAALDLKKAMLPKNHPDIGELYCDIGQTFVQKQDFVKAAEHFQLAHKIYVLCLPPQHPKMVRVILLLGLSYAGQGDYTAARQHVEEGINIIRPSDSKKAAELEKLIGSW